MTIALKPQTDSLTKSLKSQTDSLTKSLKSQTDSLTKSLKSQTDGLTEALKSQKDTIDSIKAELDKAEQAQNSVRLVTKTEESLNKGGLLNTKRSWRSLFLKKYYNLSKYLGTDSSFKMVLIGQACTLKVSPSVPIKLKRLVSHTGTLKEKKDYTVKNDSIITFIDPRIGRMDILAVVERQ